MPNPVKVIDIYDRELGNTSTVLARKYIKQKRAIIVCKDPFTIKLLSKKDDTANTLNILIHNFSNWPEVHSVLKECELFEIKEKMVDVDFILDKEDIQALKEYEKEKQQEELISHEALKKELGL